MTTLLRLTRAIAAVAVAAALAWVPLHAPNAGAVRCPVHDQPIGSARVCGFVPLGPDPTGW